MIPYARQHVTAADVEAVVATLESDFLTQGPAVPRFEDAVAAGVGAQHAVAMNSATAALHVACLALGLGRGDLLWTVPNTFVASANCARFCGAEVDFVDIDPATWCLSVSCLEEKLARAERLGRLPKVVVPVHFGGQPTDQEAIYALSQRFGFKVLEDASHSIGASRNREPVGSCRWADVAVFSFHPVKIITSGEGGMALTNNVQLAETMRLLRSHGITRDATHLDPAADAGPWYYEQQALGFNYRLTDIQAALGLSQFGRLEANVARRNALAERYNTALAALPLRLPVIAGGSRSAFHLYVVRVDTARASRRRRDVLGGLRRRGIGASLHYLPVHLQPYYQALGFAEGYCPEAEAHGREAITLPLYVALDESQQDEVVEALREEFA